MGIASVAMWMLIVISVVIAIIVIVVIRNSVVYSRRDEDIKVNGKEAIALVIMAIQHNNQNTEGLLSLQLTVEFSAENGKITTKKDVMVKVFHADAFKTGNNIVIRYKENKPEDIVVMKSTIHKCD